MYGVSKVFGENLGRYYRLKYGLDLRGMRYPGIVGSGFRTPSLAQYASMIIEESAMGRHFTLQMEPGERLTRIYRSIPKFDDRCAREEWGWQPEYDHERMIDDFIADPKQHPERYP